MYPLRAKRPRFEFPYVWSYILMVFVFIQSTLALLEDSGVIFDVSIENHKGNSLLLSHGDLAVLNVKSHPAIERPSVDLVFVPANKIGCTDYTSLREGTDLVRVRIDSFNFVDVHRNGTYWTYTLNVDSWDAGDGMLLGFRMYFAPLEGPFENIFEYIFDQRNRVYIDQTPPELRLICPSCDTEFLQPIMSRGFSFHSAFSVLSLTKSTLSCQSHALRMQCDTELKSLSFLKNDGTIKLNDDSFIVSDLMTEALNSTLGCPYRKDDHYCDDLNWSVIPSLPIYLDSDIHSSVVTVHASDCAGLELSEDVLIHMLGAKFEIGSRNISLSNTTDPNLQGMTSLKVDNRGNFPLLLEFSVSNIHEGLVRTLDVYFSHRCHGIHCASEQDGFSQKLNVLVEANSSATVLMRYKGTESARADVERNLITSVGATVSVRHNDFLLSSPQSISMNLGTIYPDDQNLNYVSLEPSSLLIRPSAGNILKYEINVYSYSSKDIGFSHMVLPHNTSDPSDVALAGIISFYEPPEPFPGFGNVVIAGEQTTASLAVDFTEYNEFLSPYFHASAKAILRVESRLGGSSGSVSQTTDVLLIFEPSAGSVHMESTVLDSGLNGSTYFMQAGDSLQFRNAISFFDVVGYKRFVYGPRILCSIFDQNKQEPYNFTECIFYGPDSIPVLNMTIHSVGRYEISVNLCDESGCMSRIGIFFVEVFPTEISHTLSHFVDATPVNITAGERFGPMVIFKDHKGNSIHDGILRQIQAYAFATFTNLRVPLHVVNWNKSDLSLSLSHSIDVAGIYIFNVQVRGIDIADTSGIVLDVLPGYVNNSMSRIWYHSFVEDKLLWPKKFSDYIYIFPYDDYGNLCSTARSKENISYTASLLDRDGNHVKNYTSGSSQDVRGRFSFLFDGVHENGMTLQVSMNRDGGIVKSISLLTTCDSLGVEFTCPIATEPTSLMYIVDGSTTSQKFCSPCILGEYKSTSGDYDCFPCFPPLDGGLVCVPDVGDINQCAQGHEGFLCSQCHSGWSMVDGHCIDCDPVPLFNQLAPFILVILSLCSAISIFFLSSQINSGLSKHGTNFLIITLKCCYSYLHTASLLAYCSSYFPLPLIVHMRLQYFLSYFGRKSYSAGASCLLQDSYNIFGENLFHFLLSIFLMIFISLPYFYPIFMETFGQQSSRTHAHASIYKIALAASIGAFTIYPSSIIHFMEPLTCSTFTSPIEENSVLSVDASFKCGSDEHLYSIGYSITGLIIFGFGIPCISFFSLKQGNYPNFLHIFHEGYRDGMKWMGAYSFLEKLTIICAILVLIGEDPLYRAWSACLVTDVNLIIFLNCWPWKFDFINRIELFQRMVLSFNFHVGVLYATEKISEAMAGTVLLLILFLNILAFLIVFTIPPYFFFQNMKGKVEVPRNLSSLGNSSENNIMAIKSAVRMQHDKEEDHRHNQEIDDADKRRVEEERLVQQEHIMNRLDEEKLRIEQVEIIQDDGNVSPVHIQSKMSSVHETYFDDTSLVRTEISRKSDRDHSNRIMNRSPIRKHLSLSQLQVTDRTGLNNSGKSFAGRVGGGYVWVKGNPSKQPSDAKLREGLDHIFRSVHLRNRDGERMIDIFKSLDADGSGRLSRAEFVKALPILGVSMEKFDVIDILEYLDKDNSGSLSYSEVLSAYRKWMHASGLIPSLDRTPQEKE